MTTPSLPTAAAPIPRVAPAQRNIWTEIRKHRHFYYFVAPFFVLFTIFGLYALVFSFVLSFARWDGLTPIKWIGLGNFAVMLEDEILFASLWNTLVIGLLYIPPMLALAFLLAMALNTSWLRAREESGRRCWNPPAVALDNVDKSYLKVLAAAGIPIPKTQWLDRIDGAPPCSNRHVCGCAARA